MEGKRVSLLLASVQHRWARQRHKKELDEIKRWNIVRGDKVQAISGPFKGQSVRRRRTRAQISGFFSTPSFALSFAFCKEISNVRVCESPRRNERVDDVPCRRSGIVTQVLRAKNRLIVENINVRTRMRATPRATCATSSGCREREKKKTNTRRRNRLWTEGDEDKIKRPTKAAASIHYSNVNLARTARVEKISVRHTVNEALPPNPKFYSSSF